MREREEEDGDWRPFSDRLLAHRKLVSDKLRRIRKRKEDYPLGTPFLPYSHPWRYLFSSSNNRAAVSSTLITVITYLLLMED